MKAIKFFVKFAFAILFSVIFVIAPCFTTNAELSFDTISSDQFSTVVEKLDLKIIDEPDISSGFSCFNVNESGDYALGFGNSNRDIVLIYDFSGSYLYGVEFNNNGSLGIVLQDETVVLCLVRSNLAITIDNKGNCCDVKEILNNNESRRYWNEEIYANKRIVNDTVFTSEHWLYNNESLHWGSYQRLVKTMPDGEKIILFDVTKNTILRIIIIITVEIIFVIIVLLYFVFRKIKKKSK